MCGYTVNISSCYIYKPDMWQTYIKCAIDHCQLPWDDWSSDEAAL